MKPRVFSLFSGIGGFDLGLERAGMEIVGQCEIDPWAQGILKKHWPDVWLWTDVRTLTGETIRRYCGQVDVICGGYPCQPFSVAGQMKGEKDARNLWPEMQRLVCEVRPSIVILENVPGHLAVGFSRVCGALAGAGYDLEWAVVPALAFGAPHIRKRLFVIAWNAAYLDRERQLQPQGSEQDERGRVTHGVAAAAPNAACERLRGQRRPHDKRQGMERETVETGVAGASNADGERREKRHAPRIPIFQAQLARRSDTPGGIWESEPGMVRMVHGLPGGVDRIRGLGNSIVPQAAEFVGRCVMEAFFE